MLDVLHLNFPDSSFVLLLSERIQSATLKHFAQLYYLISWFSFPQISGRSGLGSLSVPPGDAESCGLEQNRENLSLAHPSLIKAPDTRITINASRLTNAAYERWQTRKQVSSGKLLLITGVVWVN